jgi:GGDEF domain-containing protein
MKLLVVPVSSHWYQAEEWSCRDNAEFSSFRFSLLIWRHDSPFAASLPGMSKPFAPVDAPYPGMTGLARLRSLIGRPACPPRSADEHLSRWYEVSGSSLTFGEWCDPAVEELALAAAVHGRSNLDGAVVEFAQARAGADHPAESIAADIVALMEVVDTWSSSGGSDGDVPLPDAAGHPVMDGDSPEHYRQAVSLVARALTAWASAQVEVVSVGACTDPVTGLVTGGFLRARLRELHAQCEALAIAPQVTFGSLVVQLVGPAGPLTERMAVRVAISRMLRAVLTAGETVATIGDSRFVAVMPAYALAGAESDLTEALMSRGELGGELGIPVRLRREAFADHAEATWRSLAGIRSGD